jgi:hypothetical protein
MMATSLAMEKPGKSSQSILAKSELCSCQVMEVNIHGKSILHDTSSRGDARIVFCTHNLKLPAEVAALAA